MLFHQRQQTLSLANRACNCILEFLSHLLQCFGHTPVKRKRLGCIIKTISACSLEAPLIFLLPWAYFCRNRRYAACSRGSNRWLIDLGGCRSFAAMLCFCCVQGSCRAIVPF